MSLEFYQVNASIGGPKNYLDQVAVMGEHDYQRFGRELRQRGKASLIAVVVPVDEEVIRDEREWCSLLQVVFDRSKPQSHVKLVLFAGAQPVDSDERTVGVNRQSSSASPRGTTAIVYRSPNQRGSHSGRSWPRGTDGRCQRAGVSLSCATGAR